MTVARSDVLLNLIQSLPIRSRDLRVIPLRLNTPQRMVYDKMREKIDRKERLWAIVLKARREGVSTLLEAMMLSRVVTRDLVHAMVMASNAGNTSEVWRMAKLMVEQSPLKRFASVMNKEIHFGQSKLIVSTAGSPDATRAFDLTCVHMSEVAFWENHDTMLATLQCLPDNMNTYCFIESTANGKVGHGEMFYNLWCAAERGENDFIPIFLPWFQMPEYSRPGFFYKSDLDVGAKLRSAARAWKKQYGTVQVVEELDDEERMLKDQFKLSAGQLAWRRWAIPNKCKGSIDMFNQEYPATPEAAFIQSGLPMFRTNQLAYFHQMCMKGLKYRIDGGVLRHDPSGYVEVWKDPEPGHKYVIGADTSMGYDETTSKQQRSRSAACVLDMETLEQVAEYDAATPPHVQARHLAALGRRYNNALLAPEVTSSGGGGGRELIVYLKELKYWNLHVWRQADRIRIQQGNLYGWETNARTRPMMIARIREVIEERSCKIHSTALLKQLSDFGENDEQRMQALTGRDDLLFAFGIALCSRRENYVPATVAAPLDDNPFDPKRYGFAVQAYDIRDAITQHWERLRRPVNLNAMKTWQEL